MALGFGGKKKAPPSNVLTASGVKITPGSMQQQRSIAGMRQAWQEDAWSYTDLLPEVRFGHEFMAHAVASVGWTVRQVNDATTTDDDTAEPIPFDSSECTLDDETKDAAREELARLPLASGSPFVERFVRNMSTPGECYVHSFAEPGTGVEQWAVRSTDELRFSADNRVMTLTEGLNTTREIDPTDEDVLRMWKPHPRYGWLADSAMRPLLDVCEDVLLAGRESRAASRSRVATNGLLLVPRGLTLQRATDGDGKPATMTAGQAGFIQAITEAMTSPIMNEGHAGAVMPVMIVGDADDLKELRHVALVRETSADLAGKVNNGLKRIATGLDMPAEVISGMGDSNHWSAWLIDSSTARYHIAPWCRTTADCFTGGFMRPALRDRQIDPRKAAKVQVWYDLGPITENPNRRADAMEAWDRNLISNETLRRDLGYSNTDAPTDKEVFERFALRVGMDPGSVPTLLRAIMSLGGKLGQAIDLGAAQPDVVEALPAGSSEEEGATGPRQSDEGGTSGGGTPNDGTPASGGIQASAALAAAADSPTDGWVIPVNLCRRMTEIEQGLVDRVLSAADPVVTRAVERAGGRARNVIRSIRGEAGDTARASIEGAAPEMVLAAAGVTDRTSALALGIDEQALLKEAWAPLEERYKDWVASAIDDEVRTALQILDPAPNAWVPLGTPGRRRAPNPAGTGQTRAERKATATRGAYRVKADMRDRIDKSWDALSDSLTQAATRQLYSPGALDLPTAGERPNTVIPADAVLDALDIIGGGDGGSGIAGGRDLVELMREQGARDAGREWVYGLTPRHTFVPHLNLDGTRFTRWDDGALSTEFTDGTWVGAFFRPRDHKGCLCHSAQLYAVQSDPDRFDLAPAESREAEIDEFLRDYYDIRSTT